MKVGLVVNPVAGMGGRVGLKGTDDVADEARDRGAEPVAGDRALRALEALRKAEPGAEVSAASGSMGEDAARGAGFEPDVVDAGGDLYETTAEDTRDSVRQLVDRGVDLLLFVGGDGTAADVAQELADADEDVPALGVPAGVKVYSAVFGETPEDAGRVAAGFERTESRDAVDADEDSFREGEVELSTKGVLDVPVDPAVQSSKSQSAGDVEGLSEGFAADVEEDVTYVLGPGGTMAEVKRALGFEPTSLGVDVWRDGDIVARDAAEDAVLDALGEDNVVAVSPIGGQGFVLGRGNQQISPDVLRSAELRLLASQEKLRGLDSLRVDTGDLELDEELRGWTRVRVGRHEYEVVDVE